LARPGHHHTAALHDRWVLPVRGGGRPAGLFPGGAGAPIASGYESRAIGLDRNEIGALLVAGGALAAACAAAAASANLFHLRRAVVVRKVHVIAR
jgi:hypothetical protein